MDNTEHKQLNDLIRTSVITITSDVRPFHAIRTSVITSTSDVGLFHAIRASVTSTSDVRSFHTICTSMITITSDVRSYNTIRQNQSPVLFASSLFQVDADGTGVVEFHGLSVEELKSE